MSKGIAIITARGGSKRIPRKNIKEFLGKPIMSYSIETAKKAQIFDEIMVSTDDKEIAEVAKEYGASVPFLRSQKTSNDYATTEDVIMEVLEEYEKRGKTYDYVVCLYPTAPFVKLEWLKAGVEMILRPEIGMVMTMVKFSFPPQRCLVKDGDCVKYKWPEYMNSRSQDLEAMYHDGGQFYCYDVKKFKENAGQFSEGIAAIEIEESQVQDIDTFEDWKIAEMKYRILRELGQRED